MDRVSSIKNFLKTKVNWFYLVVEYSGVLLVKWLRKTDKAVRRGLLGQKSGAFRWRLEWNVYSEKKNTI